MPGIDLNDPLSTLSLGVFGKPKKLDLGAAVKKQKTEPPADNNAPTSKPQETIEAGKKVDEKKTPPQNEKPTPDVKPTKEEREKARLEWLEAGERYRKLKGE